MREFLESDLLQVWQCLVMKHVKLVKVIVHGAAMLGSLALAASGLKYPVQTDIHTVFVCTCRDIH